jgi:hypothetical protein
MHDISMTEYDLLTTLANADVVVMNVFAQGVRRMPPSRPFLRQSAKLDAAELVEKVRTLKMCELL